MFSEICHVHIMYQPKDEFIKKVVFNDDIKIIGVSEPHTDFENEKKILTHLDEMNQYEGNPKKLFSEDSTFQASENPNMFLQGLHNVMAKKLQMTDTNSSEEISHKSHECTEEQAYFKNEAGAWILKSDQDMKERIAKANQEWEIS